MGLRLVVWDATGRGSASIQPALTASWRYGVKLYGLRPPSTRVDASFGASSWQDAFAWLCSVRPGEPIDEVQYWGHGLPGRVLIGADLLNAASLAPGAPLEDDVDAFVARLRGPDALVWFRTCGAFGGAAGHTFAAACAARFGCRVAGHTFVIGPLQSGLHTVTPTSPPSWPLDEGQGPGGALLPSTPTAPHTITCLHGAIPAGW
jgi:hypothetical protein